MALMVTRTQTFSSSRSVAVYRQPNDSDLDPEKGTLRTVLVDGTLGPVETAQRIDGAEGGAMKQIMYDDPKNAERNYLAIKQEAEDLLRTTAEAVELDWDGASIETYSRVVAGFDKAIKRNLKLSNGQTLTLSPAELIFLHLSLRDLDTQEQILNTGIVFKDKDISNKTVPITIADIITIRQMVTPKEMAFADSMSHWLNSTGKTLTAEIFRQAGESRELRDDYFYRVRSKAKTPQNIKLAETNVIQEVTDAGILKERTGSGAPVVIDDVFLTFFKHVDSVAKAHAFAMPIRNMKMVLGDPTIKRELTRVYGKQMIQYWMDRLIHISQLHTNRTGKAEQFMNRILGAFSKSVLGLNPSPRLKQFGGLFPASTQLGGNVFTHYAASFTGKTFDKTVEEMENYSPEFRDRYAKHAVHLTSNLFEDTRPLFGRQKLTDKTLNGLQKSDQRILVSLWLAAKEKIKNENPGASEKAVLEKTARLTEKVVNNTQNITSILDMSNFALMSKSNPFTKPLALFKSNAERMQNMVRQSVWTYRKSSGSAKDVRKLVNVLAAVMIGNAGTSVVVSKLMRGAIGLIRGADGDDDRTVMAIVKDNTMELVLENLGNYYLIDNLSRMVSAAFSDKYFWRQVAQGPFESLTVDAVESLKNLSESINAFYQDETFEAGPNRGRAKGPILLTRGLTGLVRTASQLTGLPLFPVRALEAGLRRRSGRPTRPRRQRPLRRIRQARPKRRTRRTG